jgi:hypothetical protein
VILCPNAGGDIARPPQLVNVYIKRENTEGKKTKEEEEERRKKKKKKSAPRSPGPPDR